LGGPILDQRPQKICIGLCDPCILDAFFASSVILRFH
jgi:hypothetical protein